MGEAIKSFETHLYIYKVSYCDKEEMKESKKF